MIILDHQENIILDPDNAPIQNYHAFDYNLVGLKTLAHTVRREEIEIIRKLPDGNISLMFHHLIPEILPCLFNWFATTIVSHLRLIALVDLMSKETWTTRELANRANRTKVKTHCTDYVRSAVPDVYRWRNKVAAHFAATAPLNDDNIGTLEQSIMNPVSYQKPYFHAGAMTWTTEGIEADLPQWALTKTYEELADRYWPEESLEAIPSRARREAGQ